MVTSMRRAMLVLAAALFIALPAAPAGAQGRQYGSSFTSRPLSAARAPCCVRIVAQITLAPGVSRSAVEFFVDGIRVGTVADGPPFAVGGWMTNRSRGARLRCKRRPRTAKC